MAKRIGYGKLEWCNGQPAVGDIFRERAPTWEGNDFFIGLGADFRSAVPAEFFRRREDPGYVQAMVAKALAELVPDAMNQIHGRLRDDRPEWIDPVAEIDAAYTTSQNRVEVGPRRSVTDSWCGRLFTG